MLFCLPRLRLTRTFDHAASSTLVVIFLFATLKILKVLSYYELDEKLENPGNFLEFVATWIGQYLLAIRSVPYSTNL